MLTSRYHLDLGSPACRSVRLPDRWSSLSGQLVQVRIERSSSLHQSVPPYKNNGELRSTAMNTSRDARERQDSEVSSYNRSRTEVSRRPGRNVIEVAEGHTRVLRVRKTRVACHTVNERRLKLLVRDRSNPDLPVALGVISAGVEDDAEVLELGLVERSFYSKMSEIESR